MVKPSLGESVLEGMRNLHLGDEDYSESRLVSRESRSKAYPVNHTPKPITYHNESAEINHTREVRSPFVTSRPAPVAAEPSVPSRMTSASSINKRNSLRALNISKVRRDSKGTTSSIKQDEVQSNQLPSIDNCTVSITKKPVEMDGTPVVRRSTIERGSAIPRFRGVSASGSPYATPAHTSPKTVQLKRARGQIFDMIQQQASRSSTPSSGSIDTAQNWVVEQESPTNPAIVRDSGLVHGPSRQASMRASSNATVRRNSNYTTDNSVSANKESARPHFDEAEILRMKNFRFPSKEAGEVDEDTRSELTRVTSASSKAGTIYAQDEHGGYRLKPLSQADPKHGPRVRIEDDADDILLDLDEEQLAQVEAKREAYLRKYPSLTRKALRIDATIVPELASLEVVAKNPSDSTQLAEPKQVSINFQQYDEKPTPSAKVRKLAPQVPTDIPSLAHSPIGWPLMISKIAPFAEVEAGEGHTIHRKSVSDSDLRTAPSTPRRHEVEDECPGSAYTLRTALNQFPRTNSVKRTNSTRSGLLIAHPSAHASHKPLVQAHIDLPTKPKAKPRKSLPELVARPFHSAKLPSKNDTRQLIALKKETKDLLESYGNRQASLREVRANAEPRVHDNGGHSHAHPPVSSNSIPSSPRNMRSFSNSVRHMSAQADIDDDLPSSPPIVSGSVSTNKPTTIKTKLSGIFHKPSKEGILRRSMSRMAMKASKEPTKVLSPLPGASPMSSPMSRNNSSVKRQQGSTIKSTPPSSYLRSKSSHLGRSTKSLHNNKLPDKSPATDSRLISEDVSVPKLVTSALEPIELRDATQLAFTLLDRARGDFETNSTGIKRHEYVELAKVIANTVTAARDVEKAVEEAKQAAVRAEMEAVRTKQAVVEVCECVETLLGWNSTNGKD